MWTCTPPGSFWSHGQSDLSISDVERIACNWIRIISLLWIKSQKKLHMYIYIYGERERESECSRQQLSLSRLSYQRTERCWMKLDKTPLCRLRCWNEAPCRVFVSRTFKQAAANEAATSVSHSGHRRSRAPAPLGSLFSFHTERKAPS